MKTSSKTAHEITKPLLSLNLIEGDEWYAVSKKWYTHFAHFAYLDQIIKEEKEDINEDMDMEREYPPLLNNSELRNLNNTYELRKDLNENQHFVWINNKLYQHLIEWFGVEDGSLSFKREVINIGNEIRNELIIEMYPIFVCCVLCHDDGSPDVHTKRILPISRHSNLNILMKQIVTLSLDDDNKNVRIWKTVRKASSTATATAKSQEGEGGNEGDIEQDDDHWNPFPANTPSASVAASEEELPPPSYDEVTTQEKEKEEEAEAEEEKEWILLSESERCVAFGEWALNIDLSSAISYMFEVRGEDGKWKRKYDANKWRESIFVGLKIDIYDSAYHKWYTGQVTQININGTQTIKVHYDGYSSNYDECLDKESQRIDVLNTYTAPDPFWTTFNRQNNNNNNNYMWNMNIKNDDATAPMDAGCVGLRNLGNTCFMNSTIQCLSHCPLFVAYFLNSSLWKSEINRDNPLGWKGKVAETWSSLLSKYWSSSYSVLAPNELKATIGQIQPRFSGYQQHDSSELLQFLLDGLHEDLNRILNKPYCEKKEYDDGDDGSESWAIHKERNDSIIVDLIQGQLKSRVECPDCSKISVTFDPFMFLSVPLPTEKKYVIKVVTVIFLDLNILPKKYAIKLAFFSTISELKDELSAMTLIAKNRLIVCDVWNHHIYNVYPNYGSIDEISDSDNNNNHTLCYEVATDQQVNQLLFANALDLATTKFKIIPIYHQLTSSNMRYSDVGIPLVIKLPSQSNICIALIQQYIEKLIAPYLILQNIEKWMPINNDIIQMFSSDEEEEEEEEDEDKEAEKRGAYEVVVLDKYGRSCGECSYSAYCNGCALDNLSSLHMVIPDSSYETRAFGIRWECGAQNCFNHNVFVSPLNDESVSKHSSYSSSSSSSSSSSYTSSEKTLNLSECIDEFVLEETLSKNDAWYCRDCGDHKCAKKKLDLYSLPDIFIIHLKRFTQNGYYREKNDAAVQYPINGFDLSPWIGADSLSVSLLYDLFAVSIHSGGLGGGHYIAYAKNLNNSKWYEFDDSSVSAITEKEVFTSSAYVLFYNKRNIKKEAINVNHNDNDNDNDNNDNDKTD